MSKKERANQDTVDEAIAQAEAAIDSVKDKLSDPIRKDR